MKRTPKAIVAAGVLALLAIAAFIVYSKAVKPIPPDNVQAVERKFDGLMGSRYTEILLVFGNGLTHEVTAGVYNTMGLNGSNPDGGGDSCPAALVDDLDLAKVTEEHGALKSIKNGPRLWTVDHVVGKLGKERDFQGLKARWVMWFPIPEAFLKGSMENPYGVMNALRDTSMVIRKGSRAYVLDDPQGITWVMKSASLIKDKNQKFEDLQNLGSRLKLPTGWKFRSPDPRAGSGLHVRQWQGPDHPGRPRQHLRPDGWSLQQLQAVARRADPCRSLRPAAQPKRACSCRGARPMARNPGQVEVPPGGDSAQTHALLHRVLKAVEKDGRRGRLELLVAIVLSLATLASTWCGYQTRQWGGVAGSNQVAADTAERQAAENTIVGLQLRTQDGLVVLEFWRALRQADSKTSETIKLHMRPQLRQAIEASIAAGILTNPEVPGPLQRPEYVLPEEQTAAAQRERAGQHRQWARAAGERADQYVLLTLMFASVLFFGGIAGTFTERRVRIGLAIVALASFLFAAVRLFGLPPYTGG